MELPVTMSDDAVVLPVVEVPEISVEKVPVVNDGLEETLSVLPVQERLDPEVIRVDGVVKNDDHSVDDAVSGIE